MNPRLKQVAKTIVAVALIAYLVRSVNWHEIQPSLARLQWWALAVVGAGMIFELLLNVWKWSRALMMHGIRYPYGYLFRTVCTAFFLNNFLPTSIGGDAYRVFRTIPPDGYRSRAVSAVLVDRATGFAALLTLGMVGALFLRESPVARAYLSIYAAGGGCALLLLISLYFGWFKRLTDKVRHLKAVDAIQHNLERLRAAKGEWLRQIALSTVFQSVSVGLVYWLFWNTGEGVPLHACAMITAAAAMAALLPVSLNGIGLMEGSFVAMATALGVPYPQAVLVSIVRRLGILALSLLCGLVYLAERQTDRPTTIQAGS